MKKLVLLLAVAALLLSMLCACSKTEPQADEKVLLKVSSWSREDSPEEQKQNWEALKKRYQDKYPNVEIDDSNTYVHNVQTFNAKAAAGQLPAWLDMPLTEIQMLRNNGYTADITQGLKDNGLLDKINPEILDLMTDENGKICGLPSSAYTQGLVINKQLFTDAGLVDAEGNPLYPQTWEELAEYSQTIREKTGVAGFVMPTIENCGGWIFMNIAWSYGVNFEEQQKDGAWKAVFDTQEFRDAVSFVRDLKWKYNAFPDDTLLGYEGYLKSFATGLAAMTVADPGIINTLTSEYGMDKDDIVYAKLPAGPAGRYVLMGGSAKMFFADDTPEQIDAAIKWLMMEGVTPDITDDVEKTIRENCQQNIDNGGVVLPVEIFSIWQSPERSERLKEIYADYANVELSNFADYMDSTGVTLRPEETACCQQLYAVLDGVIQEVIANENADIDALTVTAVNDFQQNHLDKMDY